MLKQAKHFGQTRYVARFSEHKHHGCMVEGPSTEGTQGIVIKGRNSDMYFGINKFGLR